MARFLLAIGLGVGIPMLVAATAWAGPKPSVGRAPAASSRYSDADILKAQTKDEGKIREIREQEINQLRIALGRRIEGNRRADLYLRMAEIYMEAYRMEFLLEGRVHEKRLAAGHDDDFIDRAHSKPFLAKGIQACKEILDLGIKYDKMDNVYYFLGFYYGEQESRAESLRYFDELTRKFPGSPFVSEAYHELGNDAYGKQSWRKAQAYFEQALKDNKGDSRPRILHKLAWTLYRTKQYDQAVKSMKEAVAISRESEKFISIREEALRDMAIFMTETGKVDEAIEYFQDAATDRKYYPKVLERLGRQYERNVETEKAVTVYESLLKTHPDSDEGFRVRVKLFDLDLRRGKHKEALARIIGKDGGSNVEIPVDGNVETLTAAQNLRAMVRRTATEHHEKSRKDASKPALLVAESFYEAYLSRFLDNAERKKEIPEIQMYLAEVKRELGKSDEASALYRKVVQSGDDRYAKEAGALWTASLAEAIQKKGQKNKTDKPSKLELEYVDAADELQESLEGTQDGREAALKAAQVLAGYRESREDAVERVRDIIAKWPSSPQALTAARLLLQVQAEELPKSEDDLRESMEELRANKDLASADQKAGSKLRAQLGDLDSRMKVMTISRHEKSRDFVSAAKGYESFAEESKSQDVAEKAYANAVGSFLKAGEWTGAARVSDAWLTKFPSSRGARESAQTTATQALIYGQFGMAAALFERVGRTKQDADSLETAARIAEASGEAEKGMSLRAHYLETYKDAAGRPRVALALAKLYESAGKTSEATKLYEECAGSAFAEECGARLGDLHERAKNAVEAKKAYARLAKAKDKKASGPFIGYARYKLAEALEAESKPEALPEGPSSDDEKLSKAMQKRLTLFGTISKSYLSAVSAGGPWGIAALHRIALWADGFATELESRVTDRNRESLMSVVGALRKKSLELWEQAYAKAKEAEVLSPALPQISERLRKSGKSVAEASSSSEFVLGGAESASPREALAENPLDDQAWVSYGNLLDRDGKSGLAKLAYERASQINGKNAAALANRAVLAIRAGDWVSILEGQALLKQALSAQPGFAPAAQNEKRLLEQHAIGKGSVK